MSTSEPDLRERLIQRIWQLSEDQLPHLQDVISQLEGSASRGKPISLRTKAWPHAPVHQISEQGTYIVTAGTLHKRHLFRSADRLDLLEAKLLELAVQYEWQMEAWAIFSNHYHFVAHSGASSADLKTFLSHLHSVTAAEINKLDGVTERQVWHNYWETQLTFQRSYLVRLNYVHQNAVKHGLVLVANQYPWCSAAWFERTASPAQVKTIYGFKIDKVHVFDDFDVWLP